MSVTRIIERWPSAEAFGHDIGLKYPSYARVMKLRGRIPRVHWPEILEAAKRRDIPLTKRDLEKAHEMERAAS